MKNPSRAIEFRPLSELTPNPGNPKAHDISTIDASVSRFGFIEAITVDGRTGQIISGHGRLKTLAAMSARGEAPPDGITLTDSGDWAVPVTVGWASRTDTEASGALIALNRTTEVGGWVDDALLTMLDDLTEEEDGLDGTGFTAADMEALEHLERDTPPDLDALADEVGPAEEDDLHLRVVMHLDPAVRASFLDLLRSLPGDDDTGRIQALLDLVGERGDDA